MRIVWAGVGVGLVAGCTPDPDELLQRGEYPVGYRSTSISYTPDGSDTPREIGVEIWYPSLDDGGSAQYAVAGLLAVPAPGVQSEPTPASDAPFHLAVYSHGSGGVGILGYPFAEHLASHGWLVLAPDHVGNTSLDLFFGTATPFARSSLNRPQDVSATMDWLEGLTDDPLAGLATVDDVLLFGHSFGGYTALAVGGAKPSLERLSSSCPDEDNPSCEVLEDPSVQAAFEAGFEDDRVGALVVQAPAIGGFEPSEITGVDLPVMLQSGGMDITTTPESSAIPTWEALDGPDDVWVDMPTGGHLTFLSICDDLEEDFLLLFQSEAFDDGCGEDAIPVSDALPVLNAYQQAFARVHLLDQREWRRTLRGPALGDGFVITNP